MTASISAKSNGTQGALVVNGADSLVFDAAGLVSGIKPGSITPAMLNGNQSGSAPAVAARAWCVFDGTLAGTNAPLAGGNVTSVTRNSAGDYTINFTTAMPDANYGITGTARATSTNGITVVPKQGGTLTVNAAQIITDRSTSGVLDSSLVTVAIFR